MVGATDNTLHLRGWNLMLLSTDHLDRALISFCKISWSFQDSILRHIFVSSAYRAMFVPSLMQSDISLINSTNNSGPRIDPCGTPEVTSLRPDLLPFTRTHCFLC